jgi:hypothetical protein
MKRMSFHIDPEQLKQLQVISESSRGRPKVAALIREAIDQFVATCVASDQRVRANLEPQLKPRLISSRSHVGPNGER